MAEASKGALTPRPTQSLLGFGDSALAPAITGFLGSVKPDQAGAAGYDLHFDGFGSDGGVDGLEAAVCGHHAQGSRGKCVASKKCVENGR